MKELARVGTDQGLARCLPFCAAPSRLFIGHDDSTILRVHRLDDLGVADAHVLHEVTVHAQRHHLVDLIIRKQAESKCSISIHEHVKARRTPRLRPHRRSGEWHSSDERPSSRYQELSETVTTVLLPGILVPFLLLVDWYVGTVYAPSSAARCRKYATTRVESKESK